MEEIWKDIEEYEKYYSISNLGRVRTKSNRCLKDKTGIMSLETTSKGYKRIHLTKPIRKRFLVHRLVAKAFISNPDNKPCINHKDNNPSNNIVTNLEWCTYSENLLYAQKQGRLYEAQSKGGNTMAERRKVEATERALSLVGSQVNSWTVLKSCGKKQVGTNPIVFREKLLCRCKCGFEQEIPAYILISKKATMCRKCAKNLHKVKI